MFASLWESLAPTRPRQILVSVGALLFGLIIGVNLLLQSRDGGHNHAVAVLHPPLSPSPQAGHPPVNVLVPVTKSNANLCKLLLTQAINGWPRPHLVSWGLESNDTRMVANGTHLAKITGVLDWLDAESDRRRNVSSAAADEFENELVVMLDAYDIWVQLPLDILVSRYYAILEAEDRRIFQRMGRAAEIEEIHSKLVFAATKRCGPNQRQSVACFPVPESPLPRDLFGPGTDTDSGINPVAHVRQRWLVSGFAIGTVRDMRAAFREASRRMELCLARGDAQARFDNGNGWTQFCHFGSDQSLFNEIRGYQEFHREVMRRHHRTNEERLLDQQPQSSPLSPSSTPLPGSPRPPSVIVGDVIDDPLHPSFVHEELDDLYLPGKPYEYGITVDYFSELSHQTSNALWDAAYVSHSDPHSATIMPILPNEPTNCTIRTPIPADLDVAEATNPTGGADLVLHNLAKAGLGPARRGDMPLYTEMCTGSVPALIHQNDAHMKEMRNELWPRNWWAGKTRALLNLRKAQDGPLAGGARTDTGLDLAWDELCPVEYHDELFGP